MLGHACCGMLQEDVHLAQMCLEDVGATMAAHETPIAVFGIFDGLCHCLVAMHAVCRPCLCI